MPVKYSIIQYVPDVIIDERINIGVVVFDEVKVRVRFLSNWRRVRAFAGSHDIKFLRDFARSFSEAASPDLLLPGMTDHLRLDREMILGFVKKWNNSIQFTESRVSLKSVDHLVDSIADRFLAQPAPPEKRKYRDRRYAIKIARDGLKSALLDHLGDEEETAESLLKLTSPIKGKYQQHTFDAVVENGIPYAAVHGISFELPEARELREHLDSVSWSIVDVKQGYKKKLPIGIVALPPKRTSKDVKELYIETKKIYESLGAEVLAETEVPDWARSVVKKIPVDSV